MPQLRSHYDKLNVSKNAADNVIRAAYKALMQHYHPDKYAGAKQDALQISKDINRSFETLIDPAKRSQYDRWLAEQENQAATVTTINYLQGGIKTRHSKASEIAAKPKAETTPLVEINSAPTCVRSFAAKTQSSGLANILRSLLKPCKRLLKQPASGVLLRIQRKSKPIQAEIFASKTRLPTLSERAYDLFEQSRYAEIKPLARRGDPIAMLMLAAMYDRGCGLVKDSQQANYWYQLTYRALQPLAESGDAVAQFFLGVMYRDGLGIFPDQPQALLWLNKAVVQANAKAQYAVACLYLSCETVPKNQSAAIFLLTQAGLQGLVDAQSRLGVMYEAEAAENTAGSLEIQKKAYYWYSKAAEQGDYFSQFALGKMYAYGSCAPRNMLKAIYWYTKAAEQGWVFAQSAMAAIYERGAGGIPQDYLLAYMWWAIAAAMGHTHAGQNKDEIALKMTARQVDKAHSLAIDWLKKHSAAN
jgi:TPR repeat protein